MCKKTSTAPQSILVARSCNQITGCLASLVFAIGTVCHVAKADEALPTVEQIREAAQRREEKAKSLFLAWESTYVFSKRVLMVTDRNRELLKDAPEYPSVEIFYELRIDGDRFDTRDVRPKAGDFGMVPKSRHSFDGELGYDLGEFAHDDPTGILSAVPGRLQTLTNSPVMLVFRPVDPHKWTLFALDESTRIDRSELHENLPCAVLRNTSDEPSGDYHELWVDSAQYLPRRYTSHRGGALLTDLTIKFKEIAESESQIHSWECTTYNQDGTLFDNCKSTVTVHELNPNIPLSEFQVVWPPGTLVIDRIARTETRLPGGHWRTPSNPKAVLRVGWLFWVNISAVTLFLFVLLIRRWSAGRHHKSNR